MPPAPKVPPCPNCGRLLQAVNLDPDTPPWLCVTDSRAWWSSEITQKGSWRSAERDFGPDTQKVLAAANAEHAAARGKKP